MFKDFYWSNLQNCLIVVWQNKVNIGYTLTIFLHMQYLFYRQGAIFLQIRVYCSSKIFTWIKLIDLWLLCGRITEQFLYTTSSSIFPDSFLICLSLKLLLGNLNIFFSYFWKPEIFSPDCSNSKPNSPILMLVMPWSDNSFLIFVNFPLMVWCSITSFNPLPSSFSDGILTPSIPLTANLQSYDFAGELVRNFKIFNNW